ncbi:XRE family transcriptional regulator [Methylobacterium radiotolerans]|nr:XRE family transcriptional regulator [Methylobacterium radiotolerans]
MSVMDRRRSPIPYEAVQVLRELGRNLKTARLRRNLTLEEVAGRIGVHRTTLAQAERGDPTVMAATYVAALWVYGLTKQVADLAAPESDEEGQALESASSRQRARSSSGGMSNDF